MTFRAAAFVLGGILIFHACSSADTAASSASAEARGSAGGSSPNGGRGGSPDAAVPVITTPVERKPVPVTIPAVGTVEPVSTVQIRAEVAGQLTSIGFKEGDEVQKGQLLFTIDPRPFEAALAQAEAMLARDTATANNQQSQQARYQNLFDRGLIPRDQYETQVATAKSSQAVLAVDKAAVETARLNLQYARITAPISGRAGLLGVHVGDIVRANDTAPMVVINQVAPIYVTFSVPGRYLADIRRYQTEHPLRVEGRVQTAVLPGAQPQAPSLAAPDVQPAQTGKAARGHVTFIDNAIDPTTGTIKLRGSFDNTDRALWPGLFLQVSLELRTEANAVVVPASAVQASQNGQYVYVVKPDQTAEMRSVTVERQQGDDIVIAKGLSGGEQVVVDGQLRLTPGARVSVQQDKGEAAGE
jgi:multidrug efflux system membrane fusion protein